MSAQMIAVITLFFPKTTMVISSVKLNYRLWRHRTENRTGIHYSTAKSNLGKDQICQWFLKRHFKLAVVIYLLKIISYCSCLAVYSLTIYKLHIIGTTQMKHDIKRDISFFPYVAKAQLFFCKCRSWCI